MFDVQGEGQWVSVAFSMMVTLGMGIAKEVLDQTYEGTSSALDFAFTGIGGILGCIIFLV